MIQLLVMVVVDENFIGAGLTEGLEIWRIKVRLHYVIESSGLLHGPDGPMIQFTPSLYIDQGSSLTSSTSGDGIRVSL